MLLRGCVGYAGLEGFLPQGVVYTLVVQSLRGVTTGDQGTPHPMEVDPVTPPLHPHPPAGSAPF
eukprot:12455846-Prorocentrum_lima.AAC.1